MRTKFSFEVFPPKKDMPVEVIYNTLDQLSDLQPDFISVTCGAGGSSSNASERMIEVATAIKDKYHRKSVAHMPCINLTKADAENILYQLELSGINEILALRGDKVPGVEPKNDFIHAVDLIKFIREKTDSKFKIYAACYPEGHTEAIDFDSDLNYLKQKVDAGVDGLISQLFFDNNSFYYFREKIDRLGVNVPIEAGIMPVTKKKQIERMINICGATLPIKFRKILDKYGDNDEALQEAGIVYAQNQIVDLLANGVDGIHLYVMNNVYVARRINEAIIKLL
ncbi:MAG: methylenetetrahydrofolate reductase [Selenomonadaceae bacterium]|nr:methylenetetrahydrofolate reductase [NAD(P)H] [Selenomonadaceae bacterium]